jgi:murein DD-endopeptidase MepM/ murein hydrolase activator NlpD
MKSLGRCAGIAIFSCLLFGCAATDKRFGNDEWYQKTKETSDKVVTVTKSTASSSYKRMQKYLEEKEVLKTFHDTGEHSEAAVLDVLHKAGVGKSVKPGTQTAPPGTPKPAKPTKTPGTSTPGASKPGSSTAQTPAPGNPKMPPVTPAAPGQVPDQYGGDYRWPLDAGIISSEYGERWGKPHKGIDIAADTGEAVYAVASGEVIYAGDGLRGYGNVVILRHDRKVTSLYAHNSALKVKQGDQVKQGDLIALLGSTGHSTGPHVHFEFREGDVAVNPHTLLPKSKITDAVPARAADAGKSRDSTS